MRTDNASIVEFMGGPFNAMNMSEGEFHVNGGLTFTRVENYGIMLRLWQKRDDGWYFRVLTFLSDADWKSITEAIRAPEEKPECTCLHYEDSQRQTDRACPQHGAREPEAK